MAEAKAERIPGFATLSIHAGAKPDPTTGARATPIYQTTSFVFDDVEHAASLFGLQAFGNIYTRIGNPTCAVLEERVAALEGGTAGLAVASGHAAQVLVMHALMTPGDEFVASKKLYGGSINQFNHSYKNFGWNVVWADPDDIGSFEKAVTPKTQGDLHRVDRQSRRHHHRHRGGVGDRAPQANVPLIVDNTLATPYLCKPIDYGADVVVHSLTKFLGGHGNSIGGHDRRRRHLQLVARQEISDAVRAAAGIFRHRPARDLRQFRLRHRLPRAGLARPRAGAVAVQRLPHPHRHRDAVAAHAAALRKHAGGRRMAGEAAGGRLGQLSGTGAATNTTRSPRNTCRRAAARCSPSGSRAATTPASSWCRT